MRKDTIIKREDGSRVKITAEYITERYIQQDNYRTRVYICGKGKRTWKPTFDTDCYNYRRLSRDERRNFEYQSQFEYVTEEELLAAKISLWEDMKPE